MSDHLPECTYSPGQPGFGGTTSGIPSTQPYFAPSPCICDRLRACEQRVREEWCEAQSESWGQGFNHGLLMAARSIREQPTQRQEYWVYIRRNEILAAIDALRGKS